MAWLMTRTQLPRLSLLLLGVLGSSALACATEPSDVGGETSGDGDGDNSTSGDGDGDPSTSGDGDGDPSTSGDGDGDGDPSTSGDGDGDGDGDPSTSGDGDGDGDPSTSGDGDGDGDTSGIMCPDVFPVFDKSCATVDDCVIAVHTTDCCGNSVAWGINAAEQQAFAEAEAICDSQYPPCECPAGPTVAEDGDPIENPMDLQLDCVEGSCTTFVP